MSHTDPRHAELVAWLSERGHTSEEIAKILAKLAEYDAQTTHESIFDSIETGEFDIAAAIQAALAVEKLDER